MSIEDRVALDLKRIEAARSLPGPDSIFALNTPSNLRLDVQLSHEESEAAAELLYRWKVAGRPHPSSVSVNGMRGWSQVMNAFRACLQDSSQWIAEASGFEEIEMIADVFRAALAWEPHSLDELTIGWTRLALPGFLSVPEPYRRAMSLVWAQGGIGESAEPGHFARVPEVVQRCAEAVVEHKELPKALAEPIAQDLFRIAASFAFEKEIVFGDYPEPDPEQDIFVSEGSSLTVTVPLLVMETRHSLHRRFDNLATTLKAMMEGPSRGQPLTLERGTRWLFKWKMEGRTQRQIADEEESPSPFPTYKQVQKEIAKVTGFLAEYTQASETPAGIR